jgi:hypothetical protein
MENIDTQTHLDNLVVLAKQDLSQAHVAQHTYSADLAVKIKKIQTQGPGAHSDKKLFDTINLKNNKLIGKKFWISNAPNVTWCVIVVNNHLVYVELNPSWSQITMTPTVGMENTLTAEVEFDHAPCEVVCHIDADEYFFVRRCHSMAFIANHYGLASALFADIDKWTQEHEINCNYNKQKLKLQLDVMSLLWAQLPRQIKIQHQAHEYWKQKNTAYAFAKKCLLETCQLVTELTGSGLYRPGTLHHQRYLDSLIYSTHMQNLYSSIVKNS